MARAGERERTGSSITYSVVTAAVPADATPLPARCFNAMMTIHPHSREIRVECAWHAGIALAVVRVETVAAVGLVPGPRIARPPAPTGQRSGLERGEIGWRDLIDFYVRRRCQTRQFPVL